MKKYAHIALATLIPCFATADELKVQCGDLPETECLFLEMILDRWNKDFGKEVRANGFRHIGEADGESISELYGQDSGSSALSVDPSTGRLGIFSISEVYEDEGLNEEARRVYQQYTRFNQSFQHKVEIEWEVEGQTLSTHALVGKGYPYLLDTMIGSIILVRNPTYEHKDAVRCDSFRLELFSLVEIGRYQADFVSNLVRSAISGDDLKCVVRQNGQNAFGKMDYQHSEIDYNGSEGCSAEAWVVYTNPFSKVKAGYKGATLEFEAIGGGWRREAVCRLP